MKKLLAMLLCALLVFSLAACAEKPSTDPEDPGVDIEDPSAGQNTQIANPFESCETIAAAAEIAGFEMTAPEPLEGYSERAIQAIEGQMIQINDRNGEDQIILRKALGADDVSGDYNTYAQTDLVDVDGRAVTMKGEGGVVHVAVWTDGDYTYAVDATGAGLSADAMSALVAGIH